MAVAIATLPYVRSPPFSVTLLCGTPRQDKASKRERTQSMLCYGNDDGKGRKRTQKEGRKRAWKASDCQKAKRTSRRSEGEVVGNAGAEWASRVRRATMASSIFIRTSNKTNHHCLQPPWQTPTSLLRVIAKKLENKFFAVVEYGRSSVRKQAMTGEKWNKANWSWLLVLNCVWFNISKVYVTTTMATRRDNYYVVVMLRWRLPSLPWFFIKR